MILSDRLRVMTDSTLLDSTCHTQGNWSYTLRADSQAMTIDQAVFAGKSCKVPYTFPVNWGLGDANLNHSSYQVAAGVCVHHLRVTGHAPAYTTLTGSKNATGLFLHRSHFP